MPHNHDTNTASQYNLLYAQVRYHPQPVLPALPPLLAQPIKEELGLPAQPFKQAADMLDSKSAVIKAELQKRQMELSRRIKDNIKTLMGDSYREAEGQPPSSSGSPSSGARSGLASSSSSSTSATASKRRVVNSRGSCNSLQAFVS